MASSFFLQTRSLSVSLYIIANSRRTPLNKIFSFRHKSTFRKSYGRRKQEYVRKLKSGEVASGSNGDPQAVSDPLITLKSLSYIPDRWIPLEKEFEPPIFSKAWLLEKYLRLVNIIKNRQSVTMLRRYMGGWDNSNFAIEAQRLYWEYVTSVAVNDLEKLKTLVTGNVYHASLKLRGALQKPWQVCEALEPARVLSVRIYPTVHLSTFAQVIVRMHLKQKCPLLTFQGNGAHPEAFEFRVVKRYVVFENHLSDPSSSWLICGTVTAQPLVLS